jgi:hypothetical protein
MQEENMKFDDVKRSRGKLMALETWTIPNLDTCQLLRRYL